MNLFFKLKIFSICLKENYKTLKKKDTDEKIINVSFDMKILNLILVYFLFGLSSAENDDGNDNRELNCSLWFETII